MVNQRLAETPRPTPIFFSVKLPELCICFYWVICAPKKCIEQLQHDTGTPSCVSNVRGIGKFSFQELIKLIAVVFFTRWCAWLSGGNSWCPQELQSRHWGQTERPAFGCRSRGWKRHQDGRAIQRWTVSWMFCWLIILVPTTPVLWYESPSKKSNSLWYNNLYPPWVWVVSWSLIISTCSTMCHTTPSPYTGCDEKLQLRSTCPQFILTCPDFSLLCALYCPLLWTSKGNHLLMSLKYCCVKSLNVYIFKVVLHWSTCNANLQRRFATHVSRTNLQTWYTFESL